MRSKHVGAWNKRIVKPKFSASSWLITEINILRCTVRKTLKQAKCINMKEKTSDLYIYRRFQLYSGRGRWIRYTTTKNWYNYSDRGKAKSSKKNLSKCYSVQFKSKRTCLERTSAPPYRPATNHMSHGTVTFMTTSHLNMAVYTSPKTSYIIYYTVDNESHPIQLQCNAWKSLDRVKLRSIESLTVCS